MSIYGASFDRAQSAYDRAEPTVCECADDCSGCYAIDADMGECCGRCSDFDDDDRDFEREAEERAEARWGRDDY